MVVDFLLDRFRGSPDKDAVVWGDKTFQYADLLQRFDEAGALLDETGVISGSVVVIEGSFSPTAIALFLALIDRGCILVPLAPTVTTKKDEYLGLCGASHEFRVGEHDQIEVIRHETHEFSHELYSELRTRGHAGLILFSSGSTGQSKAAVHDFSRLLRKFHTKRHDLRTLSFLLFDHIGGIDTMLYALSNVSCLITVDDRAPESVCRAVEKHRVEVLPASPTFLNLLLISQAYSRFDLSSLRYITYGTEVMPEITLKRCAELFPNVVFLQKYGTTEVGTLRSKSERSDSVWVKIGGEGYETRVVDGILHIKASSSMLGYLNAPSPYTEDGWFITGDRVEEKNGFLRFLGRESTIINVGGNKVYPSEVENVIQQDSNVLQVTVFGESNPIMGNIVCADITPQTPEPEDEFVQRVTRFCAEHLESFKVPVKINLIEGTQHSERYKKVRRT